MQDDPNAQRSLRSSGAYNLSESSAAQSESCAFDSSVERHGDEDRGHPSDASGLVFDVLDDRLREECGVIGVFGVDDAAALIALGLHALQHRGQEACGILTFDGERFHAERRFGLVGDNFNDESVIARFQGRSGLGHNRYSTAGGTTIRNVQPLFAHLEHGGMAVAHNGNLTNARTLQRDLIRSGAIYQSTSDTEVILHLIARARGQRVIERFVEAIRQIEGAYALVVLTESMLIGARDPVGIRPLVIGRKDSGYVLASETCALNLMGATFVREVENGEVVVITKDGIASHRPFPRRPARPCIFEAIYFARPDSIIGGQSVYHMRKGMGAELARETAVAADVVVPVPDSGVPAALGYSAASGLAFELGIIRSSYSRRTFIEPAQKIRRLGVQLKLAPNRAAVEGKRIILIDDSLVRGTTSEKLVSMMREAGAREVHMRIACPEIRHGDYYGIDTPTRTELLAAKMDGEQMRDFIKADSLAFLSVDGLYRALGHERRNPVQPQYTDHCFTGEYPTALTDIDGELDIAHKQQTVLADAR
ncbi:MAG: amidophosphoribosyltransferase [Hyphomicrobiaceae bacterium]